MTPAEWTVLMAPDRPWQIAYGGVAGHVKNYLGTFDRGNLTTNELVEALFPQSLAVGAGIDARNRIYKALKQLAERGLHEYCTKSTIKNKYGKYGWMWHARKEGVRLPLDAKETGSTLINWLLPYFTGADVELGREGFLDALCNRIADDLEAIDKASAQSTKHLSASEGR